MIGLKNSKANSVSVIVSQTTLIIGHVIIIIPRIYSNITCLDCAMWVLGSLTHPFACDVNTISKCSG